MTAPDVYAWVSVDRTGHHGIMSVQFGENVIPAAFNKREVAERFRDQAQYRADILGLQVDLIRFAEAEVVSNVTPRTN